MIETASASTPGPDAREILAQRIRGLLPSQAAVREVRMFGGLAFMVDECMAVSAGRDGNVLVRVNPDDYDELLQQGGTPAYMGADRPMGRGWLTVPAHQIQDDAELSYWITVGIDSRNVTN